MREEKALELAIGLLQLPSRVRALREAPLPRDVEALLNIVAGEGHAIADAVRATGLTDRAVSDAAGFYIEQVLLHPEADSYRALGANSDASMEQLRRNMALLVRWLHPDRDGNGPRTIFAGRITDAWNNLKTAERRSAYDAARSIAIGRKSMSNAMEPGWKPPAGARGGPMPKRSARPPMRSSGGGSQGRTKRRGRLWRILGRILGEDRR